MNRDSSTAAEISVYKKIFEKTVKELAEVQPMPKDILKDFFEKHRDLVFGDEEHRDEEFLTDEDMEI
jgi:hypothetical protein